MTLLRADELRRERTFVGQREATPEEYADYAGAWQRFEDKAATILRDARRCAAGRGRAVDAG